MSNITNVTPSDFNKIVLQSKIPVLVDFYAAWCRPCIDMAPILEEILNELGGAVSIVKIDVDVPANMALARDYGVLSIPNMKLFRNGSFIREFMGRTPKALLRAELEWAVNG